MHFEQIGQPEDVRQSDRHKLFVEGADNHQFDVSILKNLLNNTIAVESMGPSYHIKSVAQALYPSHPSYYFLVDRDDEKDEIVNNSWNNFPDPNSHNLLFWKKKELENYFLIPDFICSSRFFTGNKDEYINKLEQEANKRLYLDAANLAISQIRYKLDSNWIKCIKGLEKCKTKDSAIETLRSLSNSCIEKKEQISSILTGEHLIQLFNEKVEQLLGDKSSCTIGSGLWLDFISGKELLKVMVNGSMFKVSNREGRLLQGDEKLKQICFRLVKAGQNIPDDFIRLRELIKQRIEQD